MSNSRFSIETMRRGAFGALAAFIAAASFCQGTAAAADATPIPDLSLAGVGWRNEHNDFILPSMGAGPVTCDPAHPYHGNLPGVPGTARVADLSNPILKPWVKDVLQKFNADALAGKVQFTSIARCWPAGVPGTMLLRLNPMYIVQTPKEVWLLFQSDHQVRRIYMNRPHSPNVKPSWYGESVGHYEGDTLVVDTIGVSTKVAVDFYSTPHTEQLHVVERFHVIDGGKTLEVTATVEDPGAFNMAWTGSQRYQKSEQDAMQEVVCAEGESSSARLTPEPGLVPIPQAVKPDF